MVLASDYPFFGVLWSMLIFFLWVSWFVLLFNIIGDVFRRDASGWNKTVWLIFLVLVPFIGVFAYIIVNNDGMAKRNAERANAQRQAYVAAARGSGGDHRAGEKAVQHGGDHPGEDEPVQGQ